MRNLLFLSLFISLLPGALTAQSLTSPEGRWKTIDDNTGEVRSIIEIYAVDDTYSGRVAEILTGNDDAVCDKCSGDQKGQPILGLEILSGLSSKDDFWKNGTILDPESGKTYRLSVWYEDKDPNRLYVRGKHWTGLYRTQTWIRE